VVDDGVDTGVGAVVVVMPFISVYTFKIGRFKFKVSTMAGAHGGRRPGAGRSSGSAWKPKVVAPTAETITRMRSLVAAERDPLNVVINFVLDEALDVPTRLTAAQTCLPYIYPRLSQATVDSKHVVTHIDGAQLLEKLDERIKKLAMPDTPPLIEAVPDDADADAGDGQGEAPADG
jgi:hypothetical protein